MVYALNVKEQKLKITLTSILGHKEDLLVDGRILQRRWGAWPTQALCSMMVLKILENAIELFPKSSEPIKSIMLNEINGAAGLASPQTPLLRLKLLLSS
jgi:hypothetical protein